jgi:hypothetical protein
MYDFSTMPIPTPVATTNPTTLVLIYPAGTFTVDRSRAAKIASPENLGWWKANAYVTWTVLMVLTDVVHFRTFTFGVYIITDFDELWATSILKWQPLHQELIEPSKHYFPLSIRLIYLFIYFSNRPYPSSRAISLARTSFVRAQQGLDQNKNFFSFSKKGERR